MVGEPVRTLVFFGLFYVYLWRVVESHLIYSAGTITDFPVFYRGWAFFRECMASPGGLVRYISALASQFFYYSWAGAAVIAVQAWAITACTGWFFRGIGLPGRRGLRFIPALLVLLAYARYGYHFPAMTAILAALFLAGLYLAFRSRGRGEPKDAAVDGDSAWLLSLAVFLLLSLACFIASAAAYFLFGALCAVYELLFRRRYGLGALYVLIAVVLPYVAGVLIFRVSIVDAYTYMLPFSWRVRGWTAREVMIVAVYALYLFPVVVAVGWGLWRLFTHPDAATGSTEESSRPRRAKSTRPLAARLWARVNTPAVAWLLGSCLLLVAGAGIGATALDARYKAMLRVHYYACHRMWPEVLEAARRCPHSYITANAVNRALYHTGRLHQDLCRYLQYPEGLLLTGDDHVLIYWHKFDTLIDLGLMNLAEKNLTECMESFGEHPMILERLALVNMVKGRIEAARIYLSVLSKTLFHANWARDYLARLDADPSLADDPQIQDLRARQFQHDDTALFFAKEATLAALVDQGRQNRMAFEYLMASYLLKGWLGKFVQYIDRLEEFGFTELPPLYQEAVVIYAYGTGQPVPLGDFAISEEARRRIEDFTRIVNRHNRNKEAAIRELAGRYAGSYLFYYYCYCTPSSG